MLAIKCITAGSRFLVLTACQLKYGRAYPETTKALIA
jgi:hypothetical protein